MRLITEIEQCIQRTGMRETRFGRLAVNDPRLLRDMRKGRKLGPDTVARIRALLAELCR